MLYTCSTSCSSAELPRMKRYYILPGHGNDPVAPDEQDLDLFRRGVLTAKGFALNYDAKLRSREAYEWMERVSREAIHEDVILVGQEERIEVPYRTTLAEMMASMFGGRMKFRYNGELK